MTAGILGRRLRHARPRRALIHLASGLTSCGGNLFAPLDPRLAALVRPRDLPLVLLPRSGRGDYIYIYVLRGVGRGRRGSCATGLQPPLRGGVPPLSLLLLLIIILISILIIILRLKPYIYIYMHIYIYICLSLSLYMYMYMYMYMYVCVYIYIYIYTH